MATDPLYCRTVTRSCAISCWLVPIHHASSASWEVAMKSQWNPPLTGVLFGAIRIGYVPISLRHYTTFGLTDPYPPITSSQKSLTFDLSEDAPMSSYSMQWADSMASKSCTLIGMMKIIHKAVRSFHIPKTNSLPQVPSVQHPYPGLCRPGIVTFGDPMNYAAQRKLWKSYVTG